MVNTPGPADDRSDEDGEQSDRPHEVDMSGSLGGENCASHGQHTHDHDADDEEGDSEDGQSQNGHDDEDGHWFAFVRETEETGFQIIRVNLELQEVEPSEFPVASVVTIPYVDGTLWPETDEEWERLEQVEDQVADRVPDGFQFAGVFSAGYSRDMVFFGRVGLSRSQLECDSVGDVLHVDDPQWGIYNGKLLPTDFEAQRASDDMLIRTTAQNGDHHELARPVDHFVYFTDAADIAAFSSAVHAALDPDMVYLNPVDEETGLRYAQVQFMQTLEQPAFSELGAKLIALAEEYNGTYDGWETEIAKPEE